MDMGCGRISQCLHSTAADQCFRRRTARITCLRPQLCCQGNYYHVSTKWNAKEQQLVEYTTVATDGSLNANDVFYGASDVELAAGLGLLDVLTCLLEEGCPLKREDVICYNHAVYEAV